MTEYIAEGGFAKVFRAHHADTGSHLAIKRLVGSDEKGIEVLQRESRIHRYLDHPFILHCYGMIYEDGIANVVCDCVHGQSLLDLVNDGPGLREETVKLFTVQLLCALRYLHDERCVVHRDLKLENILIERDTIRLIDFGFSRTLDAKMATRCGSLPYSAPELLKGQKYSKAVDMWSLGVVLYTCLAGHLPFTGSDSELMGNIVCRPPAPMGRRVSNAAHDFVTRLLAKDPIFRLTIAQAINHPFISGADNLWLLTESVLTRREFRVQEPDGGLDESVVAALVERGYGRAGIRLDLAVEITNRASFAYELLKVAAVRRYLVQLINDRATARWFRIASKTQGFRPLRPEELDPVPLDDVRGHDSLSDRRRSIQVRPRARVVFVPMNKRPSSPRRLQRSRTPA